LKQTRHNNNQIPFVGLANIQFCRKDVGQRSLRPFSNGD
jgi:hypothetical protein